jgi:Tol biopolymer transport system component
MICPYCNQVHPDDAKFCGITGQPLSGMPDKKKARRAWPFILSGCIVFIGFLTVLVGIIIIRYSYESRSESQVRKITQTSPPKSIAIIAQTSTVTKPIDLPSELKTPVALPSENRTAFPTIVFITSSPSPSPTSTTTPRTIITITPISSDTNTPSPTIILSPTPPSTWQHGRLVFPIKDVNLHNLYQLDLNKGGEPELIFDSSGSDLFVGAPAWSPDGKYIAFSDYRRDKGTYIIESQPDARPVRLYDCDTPSWSPDGSQIICKILGGISFAILDTSTGYLVDQISLSASARLPVWSPENNEIVYIMKDGGDTSIWRVGLNASDVPVL